MCLLFQGIPVSQQHLLYNLRELDDGLSLSEHAIGDGARLRLVLGLRGGPVATRRLPPPEPWRDIERFLHLHKSDEYAPFIRFILIMPVLSSVLSLDGNL